jgi:queuine tRNA-ribosyltransferase accessory subunit
LRVEGRDELETPNFLALTSRGVVPHMTPDVVAGSTDIKGIHMALEDCKSYQGGVRVLPSQADSI